MSCQCKPTAAPDLRPDPDPEAEAASCSGGEGFALRVLGDDMAPEFNHGEIIIIEPDGALKHGSFVLAQHAGGWTFRQLCRRDDTWWLRATNPERPELPELPLPDLSAVHGVVIQKSVPGRRKLTKFYT